MKQFSTVLNIVLLAAVAVLYYLHFSGTKKTIFTPIATSSPEKDSCAIGHLIAYVDIDSLNNNVTFIKERKKELEAEQKQIAIEYENAGRQMEAEKNEFIKKKGNAITQQEAEEFQGKWMQMQQQAEGTRQTKGQSLAAKGAGIMENIQNKLKTYINDYNKDKKYSYIFATGTGVDNILYKDSVHNITSDIVKGFNEIMNKKGN